MDDAFIAMEFLDGVTLKHRIAGASAGNGVDSVAGHRDCRCAGCGARKGIVHRDIKPANIFMTDRGHAKVLDFRSGQGPGCSQFERCKSNGGQTRSVDERHLTSPGTALGTVAYMSPEQVRGKELDARTDLFSFGIVLYEMATGTLPFRGETSAMVSHAISNDHRFLRFG